MWFNSIFQSRLLTFWLLLSFFSPFAFAGHFYAGGILGTSRVNVASGSPGINYYQGFLTDTYRFQTNNDTEVLFGLTGGYEFYIAGFTPAIAVGIGIYETPEYQFRGQVIETARGGPTSTLYYFRYRIKSARMMAETQFTWWMHGPWGAFINAGIGPAWNRTHYQESAVNNTGYVVLPPFQSRNNINFAYQLGLGIGYAFNFCDCSPNYPHNWVALSYRYAGLGHISTGTRGAAYPYQLNTGNLYNNELYFTYAYKF